MKLETMIQDLAVRAKNASYLTAELTTRIKNEWLLHTAGILDLDKAEIFSENRRDMEAAKTKGMAPPMIERLNLDGARWTDMINGLRDIAALPDPVGTIEDMRTLPNQLRVGRMRIPLGVIGMIYESRPNVTVDASALCIKAGNACILRGGSEAIRTNEALIKTLRRGAIETGVPEDAIALIPSTDRSAIDLLLKKSSHIDLIIPRGGPDLIKRVTDNSSIPVLRHDAGICHVYIDASADLDMAKAIVHDSKINQMSVCNGLETLLAHEKTASTILPEVLEMLAKEGVEIRGCMRTCEIFKAAKPASDTDWSTEYLDKILAVRIVSGLDDAVDHIRSFGSDHTEVIITGDLENAQGFLRRVQSSTVGVNCSTAYADGYRLGLGAEIGISTTKLHAYGPMGLEGLTAKKFILLGEGQLRE